MIDTHISTRFIPGTKDSDPFFNQRSRDNWPHDCLTSEICDDGIHPILCGDDDLRQIIESFFCTSGDLTVAADRCQRRLFLTPSGDDLEKILLKAQRQHIEAAFAASDPFLATTFPNVLGQMRSPERPAGY